jgi:filamentous hemagglutinin family protein
MAGSVGTAGTGTMARRTHGGLLLGLALGMMLLEPAPSRAEVATDGTLGAKVRLTGKNVKIPAKYGKVSDKNLFHSFERFGVEAGQTVTFIAPDRLKLTNVIARVTGRAPSRIDGTLAFKVKGADLWLLNPAGILFGPKAQMDLLGSFHASTADELRFADGKVFSALDPQGSVLSVAEPQAFGFLGAKPAGITVDRSLLEVPKSKALSLVGGDIAIQGDNDGVANDDGFADEPGTLRAKAGRVSLAVLRGPGTVVAGTGRATGAVSGTIHLRGETSVISSGNGGGTIRIQGGRLLADDSSYIFADNYGETNAKGGVAIKAGEVTLTEGSAITASSISTGKAGRVTVEADTIKIGDTGQISSTTFGGQIGSSTFGPGSAGEVAVTTSRLTIFGRPSSSHGTGIGSRAEARSTGAAGRVAVQADIIELHNASQIDSSTFGSGSAGEVAVLAGHLLIDGGGIFSSAQPGSTGAGGRVMVQADTIELRGTGQIASGTHGAGDGGEVVVTVGRLTAIGDPWASDAKGIFSSAGPSSTGAAGRVMVQADTIELRSTGQINSLTFGSGSAGEVAVTAGHLTIVGDPSSYITRYGTGISTSAVLGSTGAGGRVTVTADTIELRDISLISSSTFGSGDAGEVAVKADRLTVTDGGMVETNSAGANGAAGDVSIQARHLTVRNDGLIGSSGTGSGPAGNVRLTTDTLEVGDASICTMGTGSLGGAIALTATDLIHLENAEVNSNGILPETGKSVITLEAPLIALNDSRVTSLTGTGQPLAGSGLAQLFGDVTVISPESFVAASSSVTLTGVEGDVGFQLVVPESVFLNVGDLLRESCAARRTGTASSFTAMGRGGRLPDPAGPLAGAYREPGGARAIGQAGPILAASLGHGCKAAPGG